MLNTLAKEIFLHYYHICITLGPVQRLNFSCTQPNPFNYCETHKTANTRNINLWNVIGLREIIQ